MKKFRKTLSVLLCILMLIPFALSIASAAVFESKTVGTTTSDNTLDKNTSRWSFVNTSYIYQNGDNFVVIRVTDKVYITTYDEDFRKLSEKTVGFELPIFGGFYSGEAFNYMVFGQNNTEEDANKEVYRVVKYDKSFNKISQASVIGSQCHTINPFAHGSTAMAEYGNQLTVHTARKRFKSDDGLNHQSQFTIVLDTTTMTPVNNLKLFQDNHVSHSFNQFVQYDNGARVLVDHGDAYPRSVVLSKYLGQSSYGYERYTEIDLFDIPGATGANCTGVNIGGFEVSDNNYIVAINTIDHSKATAYDSYNIEGIEVDSREAVLLISDKDNTQSSSVKKVYLTDYIDNNLHATAPYLVKLTDKWFAAMWTEFKVTKKQSGSYTYYSFEENGIKYVLVDENGNKLTDIKTASVSAQLSDCQPIFADKKIIWHYDNGAERNICSLDISSELAAISHVHSLERVSAKASTCTIHGNNAYYKCTVCGKCFKESSGTTATTADEEKLPLTAHQGGTATCSERANCSVCGTPYGSLLPHTKGEWTETSQPDCTNSGTKIKKCTVCGGTVETGIIPAKGHLPGEWQVTKEPTTVSYGTKVRYCTVCHVITSEQRIPMVGTLTVKDYSTGIEVTYPENAYTGQVAVSSYSDTSDELKSALLSEIGSCKYKAYNVTVTVDGSPITESGAFTLRIPEPNGINISYTKLYKFNKTANVLEPVTAEYENGYFIIENASSGCFVMVEKETTLTLSSSSLTLSPGSSVQLIANSDRTDIIFTSSDPSVASVDEFGNVTAHANGTAIITATVSGTDVSDTCTVTVSQSFFEMIISAILSAFVALISLITGLLG